MDKYLDSFREMISLRGLTEHTLKSYCTYIRAYLDYLSAFLHKTPEDVSWDELRDYIRWLQKSRALSDRTINCAISQLRFFTLYVLHQPWDDTQLPLRRFDEFLPYVPSKEETWQFISSMPDLKPKAMVTLLYSSGLRIGEVCRLRYEDVSRKNMRLHITHSKSRNDRYAILSKLALDLLSTGLHVDGLWDISSRSSAARTAPLIPFSSQGTFMPTRTGLDGNAGLPVILSAMLSVHTCMKTVRICLP